MTNETKITLNVYDDEGKIIKTCEAVAANFKFGAIRSLMELLNVENIEDSGALLKTVYSAWNELTKILNKCFPDMEYEDWDNVDLKELIPATVDILKYSFSEILTIPKN